MAEINSEKINQFLIYLKEQVEAGLIVVKNSRLFEEVEEVLLKNGYKQVFAWKDILSYLSLKQSVFIYINGEFSKELYDVFIQYSNRGGVIQIVNPQNMSLVQSEFDAKKAHLVYLITQDALEIAQEKFDILSKAGMIENIE